MTTSEPEPDYIDLNRSFRSLSVPPDSTDSPLYDSHLGPRQSWTQLLAERRVVILSEAGAGKTKEIRHAASTLRQQQKHAFFMRLEQLAHDFGSAFEIGTLEEFTRWIASDDEGWLLLDSIDEARLRHPNDFDRAIRNVAQHVRPALQRLHIIITGRVSAWRPTTDLTLCKHHLPFPVEHVAAAAELPNESDAPLSGAGRVGRTVVELTPTPPDPTRSYKIVALDDLTRQQVERFASAQGVNDVAKFLEAIERTDTWSFACRPQDLLELRDYWNAHGELGSKLAIIEFSVTQRLAERSPNRAQSRPLALAKARDAVQRLAAATILVRVQTIAVPDEPPAIDRIPLSQLFPDWDEAGLSVLLDRPLFDEAIYGSVRFHHRSVREYLAAAWLGDLLKRQASRIVVESICFRSQYSVDVVSPALRPVLPWLALLDEGVCRRIQCVAPHVLLEGGDPAQLPFDIRRQILTATCARMASGAALEYDHSTVERFATPDLAPTVDELLRRYAGSDDAVFLLTRIAIRAMLDVDTSRLARIAVDPGRSVYTRIAAMRAVAILAPRAAATTWRTIIDQSADSASRELLAEIVEHLPIDRSGMTLLVGALTRAAPAQRYTHDRLADATERYACRLDNTAVSLFLGLILPLVRRAPYVDRIDAPLSERFSWLLKPLACALVLTIDSRCISSSDPDLLEALEMVGMWEAHGHSAGGKQFELAPRVEGWDELRRQLFWFIVRATRARGADDGGASVTELRQVPIWRSYAKLLADDFAAMLAISGSQAPLDDRLVALDAAIALYKVPSRNASWYRQIKRVADADPALRERMSERMRPPRLTPEQRQQRKHHSSWQRRDALRDQQREARRVDWRRFLTKNAGLLRAPGFADPEAVSRAQHYLLEELRKLERDSSRYSHARWTNLVAEFGEDVARAFRDGAVAYWRRHRPVLRSEGAPSNSTTLQAMFGLTGLAIDARESAGWASKLSGPEVDLVFRYAMHELNGFPFWLRAVFESHAAIVLPMFTREVRWELSVDSENHDTHYVLSDIAWSGSWLWSAVGTELLDVIAVTEPQNRGTLARVLKIVQGTNIDDEVLASVAQGKCQSLVAEAHRSVWFAIWVGVCPDTAIRALKKHLAGIGGQQQRGRFAMEFLTALVGSRHHELQARDAYKTPEHLESLCYLVHRYVRSTEDVHHEGVYSPDLRDHAQEARSILESWLRAIPGKPSYLAMMRMAKRLPTAGLRDMALRGAWYRAEQDADGEPWSVSQVYEFGGKLERTPRTHRELWELAVYRLFDFKADLEDGDSSEASVLRRVEQEPELRRVVGNHLRRMSHARYSTPQEEELSDRRKPDLRLHGNGFDAPVPIELKIADKWSSSRLRERLSTQLCGDYLRDQRSGLGVFVLFWMGRKQSWVAGHRKKLSFSELVTDLQRYWTSIADKWPNVLDVCVVGIDLTKRERRPRPRASTKRTGK